jgi:hypothetical protein
MDSSPRNRESGSPRPPHRRAPVEPLPPLNLGAWLRLQDVTRQHAPHNVDRDNGGRSSTSQRSRAKTDIDSLSRPADERSREPGRAAIPDSGSRPTPDSNAGAAAHTSPSSRDDRLARAAAYLAKIPPAISGERGHDRKFHAACILVHGFDLSIDDAKPLL